MLSKLPKPDTRATYDVKIANFPDLKVTYEGEVKGSDIKWNNSIGTLRIQGPDGKILASCHVGQFTGNCGAKYLAHVTLLPPKKEDKAALLRLIESWAYWQTNCGIIVGSDTTKPYVGQTLRNIEEAGEGYTRLGDVLNPNWAHSTALYWKDITKQQNVDHWANRKVEALS